MDGTLRNVKECFVIAREDIFHVCRPPHLVRFLGWFVGCAHLIYCPDDGGSTYIWNVVRFKVLTAASMKFRIVFWDVLPCKIIVDRRFRGTYCLHHLKRRSTIILHGSTSQKTILNFIWNVVLPRDYMPLCRRRLSLCKRMFCRKNPGFLVLTLSTIFKLTKKCFQLDVS
jgi:hypothetical protein